MRLTVDVGINDFLNETEQYIEKLDELSFDVASELYGLLDEGAMAATAHIRDIDPELRVAICDRRDKVLERIVDALPPFTPTEKPPSVYTPAIQGYRKWANAELMKDKGLAGYLLAQEIGGNSTMYFGDKAADYPYLSELPGMEMLYAESENASDEYRKHLCEEYEKIDVLVLHGMYEQTIGYLHVLRELHSGGKVYCGLDMNTYWLENSIKWTHPAVIKFGEMCDVTATSCRSVRDTLNRRGDINFACHWLPNGFYNPANFPITADHNIKENVILTVGRIGIPEKNNEELLEGFAQAATSKEMDGWTLRIVGAIDGRFEPFADNFFKRYPKMKERVIFTGSITDKAKLYAEYAKAKIFALTSKVEGGTPNVYAEALFHGCMFITSSIDAADEMTNSGQLGMVYDIGNVSTLAGAMLKMCEKADRAAVQEHIPKALEYATRYFDWNRNAKKLAYMLYK